MRKVSIVIPYFNRREQLEKTLATIAMSEHNDFEVIIVDDASDEPIQVGLKEATVIRIEPEDKHWVDVIPWNIGIARALESNPDIIIIQCAECYHVGDVIMYANNHVEDKTFVSFACWNLDDEHGRLAGKTIHEIINIPKDPVSGTGWYNHPTNRRLFQFCNAYNTSDMIKLNGLDERFMHGVGSVDSDLVRRCRVLGLKWIVTDESEPFVVHQWHSRANQTFEMYQANKVVWDTFRFGGKYRAKHILTRDFDE